MLDALVLQNDDATTPCLRVGNRGMTYEIAPACFIVPLDHGAVYLLMDLADGPRRAYGIRKISYDCVYGFTSKDGRSLMVSSGWRTITRLDRVVGVWPDLANEGFEV